MKDQTKTLEALRTVTDKIDWDAVYRSELPRIYNFFLYKVADRELAQDLTAETFERAWKNRGRYRRTIAALSTWLFGIAKNVFREFLRTDRASAQRLEPISQFEEIASATEVENAVQQQQEKNRLRMVLLELPSREQDLIALKYGAGLTNREISKIIHLSESNVGTILHRTVNKIRDILEAEDER